MLHVTVSVGVLVWTLFPKEPALFLYTSPPLTFGKQTFRFQTMAPAGWRGELTYSEQETEPFGASTVSTPSIHFEPPVRPCTWLYDWLRWRLFGPRERAALDLRISVSCEPAMEDTGVRVNTMGGKCQAYRELHGNPSGDFELSYTLQNRAGFEATYRRVGESFRVVQ